MKKILLVALMALCSIAMVDAQPRSIGFRSGFNYDLSYQHYLNEASFLTFETGVPGFAFSKAGAAFIGGAYAAVIYDMLDPYGAKIKWDKKGEWHWYMGCGIKGGIYGYNNPAWHVGYATHLGIEYDFDFPMIIFFDSRATFGVTSLNMTGAESDKKVFFDKLAIGDLAIGLRYKF